MTTNRNDGIVPNEHFKQKIAMVIPYYRNPKMLALHVRTWLRYDIDILANLSIYLIDDCSPEPAEPIIVNELANCEKPLFSNRAMLRSRLHVYRVQDDIKWNQHGCRNLGAQKASESWLFMIDIDRILPANEMRRMMYRPLSGANFYKPCQLRTARGGLVDNEKLPVNQFLISRDLYWKVGGYDEDYCGTYGGDGVFHRAIEEHAELQVMPDVRMIHYNREAVPDANTQDLDRKNNNYRERLSEKKERGDVFPENPVRFKYEKVVI